MYNTYEDALTELHAGIRDVQADSEMDADEFAPDLIDSMRTQCPPDVFVELCRTELGWVPSAARRELLKTVDGRAALNAARL